MGSFARRPVGSGRRPENGVLGPAGLLVEGVPRTFEPIR